MYRFVSSFVDLVAWSFKRIALNALRERLTKSGRAGVVGQQHHVAGTREHEVVPAQSPVVAPHAVWSTVNHDKQRILLALVEVWRQCDHVVNPFACFTREPEVTQP